MDPEQHAAQLYTTYCAAVGGVASDGARLPDWATFAADPTKTKQADAWRAVALKDATLLDDRWRALACVTASASAAADNYTAAAVNAQDPLNKALLVDRAKQLREAIELLKRVQLDYLNAKTAALASSNPTDDYAS